MPFKQINNHSFYYEISGEGEPLILIHGLGSSILNWENQIPFLSKSFKVIAIDLRGHGKTKSSDKEYSIKQFASDVAGLISFEKKKSHIIGISMGGMVAFQLSVDFSELVKSMTIINSYTSLDLSSLKNRLELNIRKMTPKLLGMKIMGRIIGKKLFPNKNQNHLQKMFAERWSKNKTKDYLKSINAISNWSIHNQLSEIKCSVLVIASEFDYFSNDEKQKYVNEILDARLVIIKDARHAVIFDQPEKVNHTIYNFLKNLN